MKLKIALILISCSSLSTFVISCSSSSSSTVDAPAAGTPLTVKNFDMWCTLTVNGGSPMTVPTETVNVLPGSISLVATPASGTFEIGPAPWHDTAGDTGSGDPGTQVGTGATETSTTTVTVGATAKCVSVCCPFVGNTGCPTTNQCP
jgi:hypothetical protein